MRLFPLVRRQLWVNRGLFLTIAMLVAVTSFLAAAAPRALNAVFDDAARGTIRDAPPTTKDIQIVIGASRDNPSLQLPDALANAQARWLDRMPPALSAEISGPTHLVRTIEYGQEEQLAGDLPVGIRHVGMQYRSEFADHVRYVAGGPPEGSPIRRPDTDVYQFPAAFSTQNADALQLEVGDVFVLKAGEDPPFGAVAAVEVSGIYEPIDPQSDYWAIDSAPVTYRVIPDPGGTRPPDLYGVAMIGPEAYEVWFRAVADTARVIFRFPPDHARITAPDMAAMEAGLGEFAADPTLRNVRMDTNLGELLADFGARSRSASAVLSLGLAGLLAVALTVIALAASLAVERRRESLTLVRARGGSVSQLAGIAATETALVGLPAAALGFSAAAAAVPARDAPASARLVALVLVVSILLVTALVVNQHRTASRQERRDVISVRPSPRRLVLEGLVVLLAAIGVVLLHRRGLTTEAADRGTDPFLVAVPVLLGFAAGLLALRAYPYPLRALARGAMRARGAVRFIGIARASREALSSALPIVVLLLGLALSVFGVIIDRALAEAQDRQAWQEVGADVRVSRDNLDDETIAAVAALPGVTGALPAFIDVRTELIAAQQRQGQVILIAIDLDAYRQMLADTPVTVPPGDLSPSGGDELPALVTPSLEARYRDQSPGVRWSGVEIHDITFTGTLTGFPGFDTRTPIVVVPYEDFTRTRGAPLPNTLYVTGSGVRTSDVTALVGGTESTPIVLGRADLLAEIGESPFVRGVRGAFLIGMVALGVFCSLAVLLMLVIGAASRGRTVSQLRTLGLSQRQARLLQLFEVGPLVAASIVAGVALGLALPRLVAPAVDLRPFAGGHEVASYPVDVPIVGALVGALAALVAVAVAVDAWVNRRRGLGAVLRVGE